MAVYIQAISLLREVYVTVLLFHLFVGGAGDLAQGST